MAVSIQETDAAGVTPIACNARTVTSATSRNAAVGGSAGSTPVASVNQNSGTHLTKIAFSWTPAAGTTWGGGTWTIRINITTGNTNLTLQDFCIRRLNSSDVDQGSIGQVTGQAISGSAGVKSVSITGSAQTPSAGDKVLITATISNASGQMNQQLSWTPDQLIDTPFTGVTTLEATLAATDPQDTASMSAQDTMPITLAATEAADVVALVAQNFSARLSATESPDVVALSVEDTLPASLAATDAQDVVAITVQIPSPTNDATLAATDSPDVVAVNAEDTMPASLAATDAPDVVSVSAEDTMPATLAASEAADIAAMVANLLFSISFAMADSQDVAAMVVENETPAAPSDLFRAGRVPVRFTSDAGPKGLVPVNTTTLGVGVVPVVVTTEDGPGIVPVVETPAGVGVVPIAPVP